MVNVATNGHLKSACKRLEDAFDLVVLVLTLGLDVEVDAGGIGKRLEEVMEHLGGHVANTFAMELGIPHEPGTATEVECHLAQTIVHGETEAIAADATFVAEGLEDTFAEGDARVLDGVMFIDVEVALHADGEIDARMTANLLEHVVEETKTGGDVATPCAVEVDGDLYVGLLGNAAHAGATLSGKEERSHIVPAFGDEGAMAVLASGQSQLMLLQPFATLFRRSVLREEDALATEVLGQLDVGDAVADDVAVRKVVLRAVAFDELGQHACAGLAIGMEVVGRVLIEVELVEIDTFGVEDAEDEFVDTLETLARIVLGAQAVLIADDDEVVVEGVADEREVLDDSWQELDLLEGINLLGDRWLDDECAVAIDEEELFHFLALYRKKQ